VPGGWFSEHGAPNDGFAAVEAEQAARAGITLRGIRDVWLDPAEQHRLSERAMTLAAEGRLEPYVGQTFPLDQAADAHRAIESRAALGKTLLLV
jgi:NADPH:quinone reductase